MLQKFHKIYPLQFEVIPLFLIFLVLYISFINFSSLPENIPVHFDLLGFPDEWGRRSEIFIYAGLSIFLYALITGFSIAVIIAKKLDNFINLPRSRQKPLSFTQTEKIRTVMVGCLFVLKTLLLSMNVYLLHANIEVDSGQVGGLGYWPLAFLIIILAVTGFMVYKSYRITLSSEW
jgi:uncharacterized membrane protein